MLYIACLSTHVLMDTWLGHLLAIVIMLLCEHSCTNFCWSFSPRCKSSTLMGVGNGLGFLRSEPTLRTRCARRNTVRCSGSCLFKDIGEKYWGSDILHSLILPAARKAGVLGPALVVSAASGLRWLGPSVLSGSRADPKGFRNATVHLGCISLLRILKISRQLTWNVLQEWELSPEGNGPFWGLWFRRRKCWLQVCTYTCKKQSKLLEASSQNLSQKEVSEAVSGILSELSVAEMKTMRER